MTRTRAAALLPLVVGLGVVAAAAAGGITGVHPPPTARPVMYVIGDSWTSGFGADPSNAWAQRAARALGCGLRVDAIGGTGYLLAGGVRDGAYPDRARAIPPGTHADLVVLQGGSNDVTEDLRRFRPAVEATVRAVHARFGGARVVILGPGLDLLPEPAAYREIDATLATVAHEDRVQYISMLREGWITESNFGDVIDPSTAHPSTRGQAYLAARFIGDLAGTRFPHQHDRRKGRPARVAEHTGAPVLPTALP